MKKTCFILIGMVCCFCIYGQRFVKSTSDLAALALLNPNDVHTNTYTVATGGIYTYDPNSGEATNTSTVIKPVNYAGRWVLTSSSASISTTNFASITITNNVNWRTNIVAGPAVTISAADKSWTSMTLTTNTIITLTDVPTDALRQFVVQVTNDGTNTLAFAGISIVEVTGAFVSPPQNGITRYLFSALGPTLYLDTIISGATITGNLTAGYLPYATGATTLGDSPITRVNATKLTSTADLTITKNLAGTGIWLGMANTHTNAAVGGSEIRFDQADNTGFLVSGATIIGQKADLWTSPATRSSLLSFHARTADVMNQVLVMTDKAQFYVPVISSNLPTSYATISDALAQTPSAALQSVVTRSRTTANDGGGGNFMWIPASVLATNLGTVFDGTGGYQLARMYSGKVDIRWFGAKPNTATDTSPILRSAVTTLPGVSIWFPEGNYKFESEVEIGSSKLTGENDQTILDFSAATSLTNGCIVASGSLTNVPTIGASISSGDKNLTFSSAPSLSEGDVYIVWNATDSSYSAARAVYRQGEMFQVSGVSGSTVTNTSRAYGGYTSGGTNILNYKVNLATPKVSNLKIIGFNNGTNSVHYPALKFSIATGLLADGVNVSGSEYAQIVLDRCYNAVVSNSRLYDVSDHSIGLNYGLKIDNSQRITASSIFASTSRHGLSVGGTDVIAGVINREIAIIGGTISSSTGVTHGLDFHGDAEYVIVSDVNLPSGTSVAADHTTITGCTIGNDNANGSAVSDQGEIVGFDHSITGNSINASRDSTGALVGFYPRSYTSRTNQTYTVAANTINLGGRTFLDGGVSVYPVGGINDFAVNIVGNTIGGSAENYGITLKQTIYGIGRALLANNVMTGSGIFFHSDVRDLDIRGNSIFRPQQYGVYSTVAGAATWTNTVWNISANHINRAVKTGVRLVPPAAVSVTVIGNTIWNSAQVPAGDSSDCGVWINAGSTVVMRDNHIADFEAHQLYAYTLDAITNVHRQVNTLIGITNVYPGVNVNEYKSTAKGVTYSPFGDTYTSATALTYDEVSQGVGVGVGPYGDYNTPLYVRRQTNQLSRLIMQNDIALGNTSAGAQFLALSKNSSGFLGSYPSDYANASYADNLVVGLNSDATYLTLSAESGSQRIQSRAAGGIDSYIVAKRQLAIDSTGIYAFTNIYNGTVGWFSGSGTPEGAVTASIGSFYSRTDGGAATSWYVKESNSGGNTGWVGK